MDDKIVGIIALIILGVCEYVYCFIMGIAPVHTGTIVGAVAGVVTGIKRKE